MKKFTLVLATANKHKVEEFAALLKACDVNVIAASDAGFQNEIEETESTLEGNALLKARTVARATTLPALSDDTGLEADALEGAPGVRSARFAGEACDAAANRKLLLEKLSAVDHTNRTAQFHCVLAFVDGDEEFLFEGICSGVIAKTERGEHGFGYDAIFIPDGESRTLAEMRAEEKNLISHRGRAVRKFAEFLLRRNNFR